MKKTEFVAKARKSDPVKSSDKLTLTIPRLSICLAGLKCLLIMRIRAGMNKKNRTRLTRATSLIRPFACLED
jgi:hypothetical protein